MQNAPPSWIGNNLARHHSKRLRENPGCFEDLLALVGREMTKEEFEARSLQAVTAAWLEYEAQARDFALSSYHKSRAHYVDDDIVVSITDENRSHFVTCFHEHFDSRRSLHGKNPGKAASVAQRRIRYAEDLRLKDKARLITNLRIIRDGRH
jgi:hypothetical protein